MTWRRPNGEDSLQELERDRGKSDEEIIRELRSQLKQSEDGRKELKVLLDTYKQIPKETRDKVSGFTFLHSLSVLRLRRVVLDHVSFSRDR